MTLPTKSAAILLTALVILAPGLDAQVEELAALRNYQRYGDRDALAAIARMTAQAGTDDSLRATLVSELTDLLAEPVSTDCRAFVCEQLGLLGAEESIDSLVPWTLEETTAVYALGALERIGGENAADAIRQALVDASDAQSIPLMLAAGRMNDGAAVPEIHKRLPIGHGVTLAAIEALGGIDTPEALNTLLSFQDQVTEPLQSAYATALFASVARRQSDSLDAPGPARQLLTTPAMPAAVRRAALANELARNESASQALRDALTSGDSIRSRAALDALPRISGADSAKLLVDVMPLLPPSQQAQALTLLGNSGSPAMIPVLRTMSESPDNTVRRQTYRALGRIHTADSAELLLSLAASASEEELPALGLGITDLPDDVILPLLRDRITSASPKEASLWIQQFGQRNYLGAVPLLLEQLKNADGPNSNNFISGLGEIGNADVLDSLVAFLDSGLPPERLRSAMIQITERHPREAQTRLLSLWEKSSPESRAKWVGTFAALPTTESLSHLKHVAAGDDPSLRHEALRTLGNWPDSTPVDFLLEHASGSENLRDQTLALRSAAALLQRADSLDAPTLTQALERGIAASPRPEEKRLFIALAPENPSPEMLRFLESHAGDPDIREEIARALVSVQSSVPQD